MSRFPIHGIPPRRLSRRHALAGAIAGGGLGAVLLTPGRRHRVAAQNTATPIATPVQSSLLTDANIRAFEADVEAAMETFQVPGAAIVLVDGTTGAYTRGFGRRDLATNAPVTPHTRFRLGSITKSMTALLLGTLVDDGVLTWDVPVIDLWPEFTAPTPELTRTLRLRDLLGMGSGIAESTEVSTTVVEFFMSAGLLSAADVVRSVGDLPVIAPPDTAFSYNNTLVSAAAHIGLLAAGAPLDDLEAAYASAMRTRVFGPGGMDDAALLDDPRPLGDDFAIGYARDIFGTPVPLPFVSLAGIAPAGSGLASATDLAHYLIMQMNGGIATTRERVVSADALAAMHQPGIQIEPGELSPPELRPDTASQFYGMGWIIETFRDGRRLIWHSGRIDGFSTLVGFFPDEHIGFAFLTNLDRGGGLFNTSVQASLLARLFGLNRDLPGFMASFLPVLNGRTAALAAQAQPVDPTTVTPYLGLYEDGFAVSLNAGNLWLRHDIRAMPLLALPDGTHVVTAGPDVLLEQPVAFSRGPDNVPVMTIRGFRPVRWLTGA